MQIFIVAILSLHLAIIIIKKLLNNYYKMNDCSNRKKSISR